MSKWAKLGLTCDATEDEVKRAYKKLAARNHPDRGGDVARFDELTKAYKWCLPRAAKPVCEICGGTGFINRQRGWTTWQEQCECEE